MKTKTTPLFKVDWEQVTRADGTIDIPALVSSARPEALADLEFRTILEDFQEVMDTALPDGGVTDKQVALTAALMLIMGHNMVVSVRALPYLVAQQMLAAEEEVINAYTGPPGHKGPPKKH